MVPEILYIKRNTKLNTLTVNHQPNTVYRAGTVKEAASIPYIKKSKYDELLKRLTESEETRFEQ